MFEVHVFEMQIMLKIAKTTEYYYSVDRRENATLAQTLEKSISRVFCTGVVYTALLGHRVTQRVSNNRRSI